MTESWATIVTAGLAALAAGASWASVIQNRRQIRASLEPHIQILLEGGSGNSYVGMQIRNTGGGTAKGANFFVAIGENAKTLGQMGIGFLAPGDGAHIIFDYNGEKLGPQDVRAIVVVSDAREFGHAWTSFGGHKVFRTRWRRRPRDSDGQEALDHFFPDLDFDSRSSVGFNWRTIRAGEPSTGRVASS